MKILQVISSLGNGGAEKFIVELCNELSKTNNVTLCSFKKVQDWMIFPRRLKPQIKLVQLNKKNGFDFTLYFRLIKLIRKSKIETIHSHLDSTIKYILPLLIFLPKVKFIFTIHSNLNSSKIKLFDGLYKIKFAAKKIKFVCISPSIYEDFNKRYPQFTFILIENGISQLFPSELFNLVKTEVNSIKLTNGTKVFTCIGNYTKPKNFSLLTQVFSTLCQEGRDVILLIIGNDTSADKKEWNKIKELKAPNTFMLGLKANVQDYLLLSNAYCLCSLHEGLPISVLEAYSLGLPVLSTPAGGVPSILENSVNGYLTNDYSFDSYYKMIDNFLKISQNQINKIGQNNSKHFMNNFTIERTANKYIEVYKI